MLTDMTNFGGKNDFITPITLELTIKYSKNFAFMAQCLPSRWMIKQLAPTLRSIFIDSLMKNDLFLIAPRHDCAFVHFNKTRDSVQVVVQMGAAFPAVAGFNVMGTIMSGANFPLKIVRKSIISLLRRILGCWYNLFICEVTEFEVETGESVSPD